MYSYELIERTKDLLKLIEEGAVWRQIKDKIKELEKYKKSLIKIVKGRQRFLKLSYNTIARARTYFQGFKEILFLETHARATQLFRTVLLNT